LYRWELEDLAEDGTFAISRICRWQTPGRAWPGPS